MVAFLWFALLQGLYQLHYPIMLVQYVGVHPISVLPHRACPFTLHLLQAENLHAGYAEQISGGNN